MYTGGVSSLAEQIAGQLQSLEDPKLPHEKKDSVSTVFPGPKARGSIDTSLHLPESVVFSYLINTMLCCCCASDLVFCLSLTSIHLPLAVVCVC